MSSKAATDLLELVDWKSTECLNESPEHTLQNVLKQVRTAFAAALADSASFGPVHSLNATSIALCACSVLRMVPALPHTEACMCKSNWLPAAGALFQVPETAGVVSGGSMAVAACRMHYSDRCVSHAELRIRMHQLFCRPEWILLRVVSCTNVLRTSLVLHS